MITLEPAARKLFDALSTRFQLTDQQQHALLEYVDLLLEYNKKFNLTAITNVQDVITHHLADALELIAHVNISASNGIADVGTGGGVPGIPLSIMYPDVPMYLIEVNSKKVSFLQLVIDRLNLRKTRVCSEDWRTFLRTTNFAIDCVVARASLQPEELLRVFKGASPYRDSLLVYWASEKWQPQKKIEPYIAHRIAYSIGAKKRAYVFFSHDGQRHPLMKKGEAHEL